MPIVFPCRKQKVEPEDEVDSGPVAKKSKKGGMSENEKKLKVRIKVIYYIFICIFEKTHLLDLTFYRGNDKIRGFLLILKYLFQ